MDNNTVAMNALLAKLYKTFTAPDVVNNIDSYQKDAFFSFAAPGIPVTPASFDFLKLANLGQLNAASVFAQAVGTIPSPTGFWSTKGAVIWNAYRDAINRAVVKPLQISPEEQAKLDAAHRILYNDIRRVDQATGKIVLEHVPSQALSDYYKDFAAYNAALRAYNTKLIYVNTHPDDVEAVQDWALNSQILANDVSLAANALGINKGLIEDAQSTIAQITGRGASVYFQQLKNVLNLSKRTDGIGSEYFPTVFFPDQFWNSNSWVNFTFGEEEIHTYSSDTSTSWGGGTSGGWGLWSWGASVQHGETDHDDTSETSNLKIAVELIQIPILRPWFDANLYKNTSWKFPDDQILSNGLPPPATLGLLPMYATSMIIARNLTMDLDMTSTHNHSHRSETHIGGSVGWGPFSLRGNYDRVSSTNQHDYHSTDSGISCPGMQIIGFICAVAPKAPNWNPALLENLAPAAFDEVSPESFRSFF